MKYIPRDKNIVADTMYKFSLYGQPKYKHKYNYTVETLLEMYGVEELPNGKFPLIFQNTNHYQWKYPGIKYELFHKKKEFLC